MSRLANSFSADSEGEVGESVKFPREVESESLSRASSFLILESSGEKEKSVSGSRRRPLSGDGETEQTKKKMKDQVDGVSCSFLLCFPFFFFA